MVGGPPESQTHLSLVPSADLQEFWLGLHHFDLSAQGKNGYFPSNCQFAAHFGEFLKHGYRSSLGSVEVRFGQRDGSRELVGHSVGIVDGQCKILIMAAIVSFVHELECTEADLNELRPILQSFRAVRCTYTHYENQAHFYLHSLRCLERECVADG